MTAFDDTLGAARARMDDAERIVLTTHVQPDGDGIGSEAALARFLRQRGKRVTVLNPHQTPRRFAFLEPAPAIVPFDPDVADADLGAADLLVVLDISVPDRLGRLEPFVRRHDPPTVILDHHAGPSRIPGLDVRDEKAAATGEIVYRLLDGWGPVDAAMATALYAAIVYDTGGFRYSNTTVRTHEIAAELLRLGADARVVNHRIFESTPLPRLRLLAVVLGSFELTAGGRLAWAAVSRALLEEVGADGEDVEGLVETLRTVEGVAVAILFKEVGPGATKVSFRSIGDVDVRRFAERFGGGGHANAAGAYVEEPLDAVVERVVEAAREEFAAAVPG